MGKILDERRSRAKPQFVAMLTATMSSPLATQQQQPLNANNSEFSEAISSESSIMDTNTNQAETDTEENSCLMNQAEDDGETDDTITKDLQFGDSSDVQDDLTTGEEGPPTLSPSEIFETSTEANSNLSGEVNPQEDSSSMAQDTHHKRRPIRANAVNILGDASIAFSPYQSSSSLVTMKRRMKKTKTRRGKKSSSSRRKENENDNTTKQVVPSKSDSNSDQKTSSALDVEIDTAAMPSSSPQHLSADSLVTCNCESVLKDSDDPILQRYLPKLTFLNDNYYTKVKPYDMGRRNLPQNQIELILRRRAVKKKDENHPKEDNVSAAVGHGRPPLSSTPTSRRKGLPTSSPQNNYDDDSTISSATAASTWTSNSKTQHSRGDTSTTNNDSSEHPTTQQYSPSTEPIPITPLPQEEIVGDTSLGLKLTILQGKVIIQAIDPLNDGRASPAQLCGFISPGDILVAVNGKSLINGTIHNPAPMDRIISVLTPLSQPIDEVSGEYSREVRLRLVLGEGLDLLREQKRREDRKREDLERRKAMGLLDRQNLGVGGGDAAGDIFGIASFMAVDQHSGMPMFSQMDDDHHRLHVPVAVSTPKRKATSSTENKAVTDTENKHEEATPLRQHLRTPLTLQEQIAQQVALDRQWMRNRDTSEFFSLNNDASAMLRPPTPPPTIQEMDAMVDPIEFRKQLLARGAKVMNDAKSLLSQAEFQDRRVESFYADEDPMEVASRVCGTASIRTGASKRRWHRGDSAVTEEEDESSSARGEEDASAESMDECDHRKLVDLAANDDSWKVNVLKRLEIYAQDTERESNGEASTTPTAPEKKEVPTSFDTFLFGGEVTTLMKKKKKSLALPPGEMTAMLFDLVDHLSSEILPGQIFLDAESGAANKTVSFSRNLNGSNNENEKASEFLLNDALRIWLQTFRPLPWSQRRAIWRKQSGGNTDAVMAASILDDNMSLSMTSGSNGTPKTTAMEREQRNLIEVIEEMELDAETRTETCSLATFYFTSKCALRTAEEELVALVETHGSYLHLHKCLVAAGKVHSKILIEKLLGVSKHDSRHRESMNHLKNVDGNMLIFYEPQMLSALLEIHSSSPSANTPNFDLTALLVSAYPDLQPWCVKEIMISEENVNSFFFKYMSSLLHHEEGNDAARRDRDLVKEWCEIMLSSQENSSESRNRECFLHIASREEDSSVLYHRDLPFLLDTSVKMSEFSLALDIANEIVQSIRYRHNKQVLTDVLQHLRFISDIAVKGRDNELNSNLLSQIITFFNILAPCLEKHQYEIDIVAELTNLLEQCKTETSYSTTNIDGCITCISENAPPAKALHVFSQWEHSSIESSSFVSAIQTSLIRGAREGLRNELSGSLLRIKRAREEGHRPMMMEDDLTSWDTVGSSVVTDGSGEEEEENEEAGGGFLWKRVLDGTLQIDK